ncbi:MAG TPA: ABC transporter ATP-binding protein, partial [Alphaproteobacteria bacterium]|nr:ABC transporter ATP-binding protein [Alphaproteobacteria bacterium]
PYRALDMVVMGRARHLGLFRAPGRRDFALARQALGRLGCSGLADRRVTELSGGERQMVMIARALAAGCDVLVLDEPTSALDFSHQKRLLHTLRDLAAQGLTIVFSSHVPQHAQQAADKVLLMQGPQDYDFGPRDQVMSEANLARLYGVPVRAFDLDHEGRPLRTVVPVFA